MQQNLMLEFELLYIRGMDFVGPFPPSFLKKYILIAVVNFLKNHGFSWYGVLKVLKIEEGTYCLNQKMENLIRKYNIHHKLTTPYHPKTSGQVEIPNKIDQVNFGKDNKHIKKRLVDRT